MSNLIGRVYGHESNFPFYDVVFYFDYVINEMV